MTDGVANVARPRRPWQVWALLAILGVLGLATMLFAPLEQLLPPGVHVPKIALLFQPALLPVGQGQGVHRIALPTFTLPAFLQL